jgi:hypothetical protein
LADVVGFLFNGYKEVGGFYEELVIRERRRKI